METDTDTPKFDSKLPNEYFSKMADYAARFDRFDHANPEKGLRLDGTPKWNFCHPGQTHWDSTESMFTARMLEYIRPGVYAKKYPQIKWQRLVAANYSIDTGAASYTVTGSDYAGKVTISKMPSTNVSMVNQRIFQATAGFFSMTEGYQYNLQEVREAIFARQPLQTTMAMAARNIMERALDTIAFTGDATAGVKGILNQSGTDTYTTPATGAGGSKSWDDKSPAQILTDLNAPIDQIVVNTNEVEIPNTWLLPTSRYRVITTLRIGDGSDSTVEGFFLKNQDFVKRFETTYKSESAPNSDWTGKRGMVYTNDSEVMEILIPQAFEQMQPVVEHFTITTLCHMRTGGVVTHRPKAIIYVDGI